MRSLMNRCCSAPAVTNMICRTYNAACRVVKPAQTSAPRAAVCSHGLSACPGSALLQIKAPSSTRIYSNWSESGGGDDTYSDRQFDRRSDRDYSDRDDRSSYRGRGGGGRRDSYGRGGRGGRSSGGRGGRGSSRASNELQPGDWACPECNYRNFGRNTTCRECDTPRPADYVPQVRAPREPREPVEVKEGDWNCTACGQHNYATRIKCFVCGESAPEEVLAARPPRDNYNRSETDWECPDCGEVNFGRRYSCRACDAPRPEGVGGGERESYGGRREYGDRGDRSYGDSRGRRDYGDRGDRREYAPRERREYQQREPREYVAKEGDWTCPSCGDVNYAFRTECRKCQASKP